MYPRWLILVVFLTVSPAALRADNPPDLKAVPSASGAAAAEAELAQAQRMADQAVAAAEAQPSPAPDPNCASSAATVRVRNPHHSMGELVNSAESLQPDRSDASHHTTDDIFESCDSL